MASIRSGAIASITSRTVRLDNIDKNKINQTKKKDFILRPMWTTVVWLEGDLEEEGVIPQAWVKLEKKLVLWPPRNNCPLKAMKQRLEPTDKWQEFTLVKIKFSSGKKGEWTLTGVK